VVTWPDLYGLAFLSGRFQVSMLPRERVIQVIRHERPDRIPIYGWVRANLEEPISKVYGSVEAFEDHYEFDLSHIFGGPRPYPVHILEALRE
jgi:uroporphyrinogen decarboxylase